MQFFFFFFFQFCRSAINGACLLVGPLIQTLPTSELRPHSTAQCTLLQTILTWWNTVTTLNIKYTLTASPTSHSVSNDYRWFPLLSAMANTHRCTVYCNSYYNRPVHRYYHFCMSFPRHVAKVLLDVRPHSQATTLFLKPKLHLFSKCVRGLTLLQI